MKLARLFLGVFAVFAINVHAQSTEQGKSAPSADNQPVDELIKRLSAAETYQLSEDLTNATLENRAILAIALQRAGNIYIEEGNYREAVETLSEALLFADTALNRINLAVAYLRQNQTEKAIEEARKSVAIDPDLAYGNYLLGNIYFTKEDYKSALPFLERVFRTSPNFEVANALGLTYLNLKQLERAKLLYDEVLLAAKKPSAELHLMFARNYERTNYPAETEREIKRALAIDPKHPRANFLLGYFILLHAGSERLSEAGSAFEEELKLTPEDFYSNFFVGVVATSENNHEKAVKYLKKSIQLNSQKSEAYLFLAQSQLEMGDLIEAEKNLRQTILLEQKEPDSTAQSRRTHFLLGRLLTRTGRKEEGEKELKIARELQEKSIQTARDEISQILGKVVTETRKLDNPNAVKVSLSPEKASELNRSRMFLSQFIGQAYHNLGVIAVRNGQTEDALAKFESAGKWKPDLPALDRNWGIVGFRAARFDKAVSPLSRQLKSSPNDTLVRRMLGVSYYFTKDHAKAVETLKPIEETFSSDVELAYFYATSLIHIKQEQSASAIFEKLSESSKKNPDALFYAGQGFMMLGSYDRAVKEFRQLLALNAKFTKANYFIGQSLIRLSRYEEAEKAFGRELEINPTDFLAKYHLALTLIERKAETEKAIAMLEDAISLKYDYANARYQLGKIYLERGETSKALEQLEIAAGSDDKADHIQYQLSIAYRKAERKDDADRALKRYQELKAANRNANSPMGSNDIRPN
jgi:tetratricopeptide (TPR) repeat protein